MHPRLTGEFIRRSKDGPLHDCQPLEMLTRREREVLLLVAEGMNNQQIPTTLYISQKTVKNHLSNVFYKLGVSDRTNAALIAVKSGFSGGMVGVL